jgi:ubiquinone/menaquinone biosynthesis C-methylase UbiE
MIALARRRADAAGLADRLRFEVADAGALPFADGQFDLVVSTMSLHHWPDPRRGLAEVRRVLRPAGRASIYDVADWILRWTRHGARLGTVVADSPFAGATIEPAWSAGRIPLVISFSVAPMGRSQER